MSVTEGKSAMQLRQVTENAELIRRLAERFAALREGETIPYTDIAALVGDGYRRYLIVRAQKEANREVGALFRSVYRVGIQRLPTEETPAVGATALTRIRRHAKRTREKIGHAVTRSNSMSNETILRSYATLSVLGLIENQAHYRNVTYKQSEIVNREHGDGGAAAAASLELMRRSFRGSE